MASVFLGTASKRSSVLQMLAFALATPVGLVTAVLFLGDLPEDIVGALVGLSAGIFVYLGATDMLPEIKHPPQRPQDENRRREDPMSRWIAWEPTAWVLLGMMVSSVPHQLIEEFLHH